MSRYRIVVAGLAMWAMVSLTGCRQEDVIAPAPVEPEYARPLGPGEHALYKLDPRQWPDLRSTWAPHDPALVAALDRSIAWFSYPSSARYFPVEGINMDQARRSAIAFKQLLLASTSAEEFAAAVAAQFDLYASVGWDGKGTVLFTGYFTPIFPASTIRTERFRHPLYARPVDLVSEPDGRIVGRRVGDQVVSPYPTRAEIMRRDLLAGQEIAWLEDPFDAYLAQIQGSAKLIMPDGRPMYLGYAGTNGHEYESVALMLVRDGKLSRHRVNLTAVRRYFREHPDDLPRYVARNPRFTFFKPYDPGNWPAGSLGLQVTPLRTIATDKRIFPRGGVTLVSLPVKAPAGGDAQLWRDHGAAPSGDVARRLWWMLDQDTGGAIRAPGRADLYFGVGEEAEDAAGKTMAEGRLYYLFLKPAAGVVSEPGM